MTGYETIEFEREGTVGWLRLARPDRLNSFTIAMWHEMRALGVELRDDAELRAVVVTGKGRAFSSGIDTTVFTTGSADSIEDGSDAGTRHADPTVDGILRRARRVLLARRRALPDDRGGARVCARCRIAARARM